MAEDLAQLEYVFRAVVLASFADGEPSAVELKSLQEALVDYPAFAAQHELRQFVVETYRLIKRLGPGGLLDEVAANLRDRHHRELAFRLSSKIIAADGRTASGEAQMLGELQRRFGFTAADVLLLM